MLAVPDGGDGDVSDATASCCRLFAPTLHQLLCNGSKSSQHERCCGYPQRGDQEIRPGQLIVLEAGSGQNGLKAKAVIVRIR